MNRKALALTLITALLVLVVTGIQVTQIASANFFPEKPPPGIQITSDGTVEGTDRIQHSGNIYTLTANIKGTIVILCDGIVLDGTGYTLEGSGSGVGVFLQARNDVTIKNMKIRNFNYGIKFTWLNYGSFDASSGKTISGNTITNSTYGIYINDFSTGNKLSANTLSNNTYGICLDSCSNNVLRDNRMDNNDFNFFVSGGTLSESINDVDQSNTVNGAPIIYWVNERSKTVPENAGYVALVSCTDMTMKNLDLSHNGQAMLLAGATSCIIADNTVKENHNGIWLIESQNNQINHNKMTSNAYAALYLSSSEGNKIIDNTFIGNGLTSSSINVVSGILERSALRLFQSSNNQIVGNQIIGNGEGISFHESDGNTISTNTLEKNNGLAVYVYRSETNKISKNAIKDNFDLGIKILHSSKNTINNNRISNNSLGILLDDAGENSILQNDITDNRGFGMQLKSPSVLLGGSENNIIHHNNFINNQPDGLDVSIPAIMGKAVMGENPRDSLFMEWMPGLGNTWDDGREGNYWSDYLIRYPDASKVPYTEVGNTEYIINENNIDRHPLMSPIEISVDSPSQEPTTTPPSETQTQQEPFIPLQVFAIALAICILVSAGLLVYYKKAQRLKKKELDSLNKGGEGYQERQVNR